MPQENGWATGPEHCDEDGRVCPYCGSENTDSGSLDTQAGQVVESDCECLDCGKLWGNLYNIAGWYDDTEELHEDTRSVENREAVPRLQEQVKLLREALEEGKQLLATHPEVGIGNSKVHFCYHKFRAALEATKGEA